MTSEEAITKYIVPAIEKTWNDKKCKEILKALKQEPTIDTWSIKDVADTLAKHGLIVEQEPCEDAISRQAVLDVINLNWEYRRNCIRAIEKLPPVKQEPRWIPVSERLPETDNKNSINSFNVLLWVKNKTHPEEEAQIFLGKLRHIDGYDGSGNFWGIKTEPCEWTIWGWCYFNEPEVIAWMPLPKPYNPQERSEKG